MSVISENEWQYYKGILPPLPKRAISGLPYNMKFTPNNSPFHTVRLWEFTNLHAVLKYKVWNIISNFLYQSNLSSLAQKLQIKRRVLDEICRYPNYATHISNLFQIGKELGLTPEVIESSVKSVRFSRNGDLESIPFPFVIDLYAWRALCHVAGDGSVKFHSTTRALPEIKWCQKQENQKYMLSILKRWNPKITNSGIMI